MITRFITEVTTKVNPFSAKSKSVRLFLNSLPPNARSQGTAISTKLLPRSTADKNSLVVKFSMLKKPNPPPRKQGNEATPMLSDFSFSLGTWRLTFGRAKKKKEDGKLLDLDCEQMTIQGLIEECDRHSRALQKQADLADA